MLVLTRYSNTHAHPFVWHAHAFYTLVVGVMKKHFIDVSTILNMYDNKLILIRVWNYHFKLKKIFFEIPVISEKVIFYQDHHITSLYCSALPTHHHQPAAISFNALQTGCPHVRHTSSSIHHPQPLGPAQLVIASEDRD